jgi:geranylgeranyl diphosphate synthase type II
MKSALVHALRPGSPARLCESIHHAVFAGGSRLRPTLCLSVAAAYGDPHPAASNAAAVSVELMHCASLVHDDLPCFDDAPLRRGKPTVHAAYGVPIAVLAGDALIVLAFQTLARVGGPDALAALAEATGPARGIIAGQAWETESPVPIEDVHRAKTAALFQAAASLGARAASAPAADWARFGDLVGRAYQAADDVLDAVGSASSAGKTTGRDEALRRPSLVRAYGLTAARRAVGRWIEDAARAIPSCPAEDVVRTWLERLRDKMMANGALGPASR